MAVARAATYSKERIEAVIARQERRFRTAFEQAVSNIRDQRTLDELADLLEQGRFEEALDALLVAAEVLGGSYGAALTDAANEAASFLSTALTVTVAFDQTNVRAVAAMQSNRLRLIQNFTATQREVTRAALADGIARGLNPRDQARLFRDSIGLTGRQQAAVENYRRLLTQGRADGLPSMQALDRTLRDGRFDRSVMRSIRDNQPLTENQVETMIGRYRERMIAHRSRVIARTEALRATHEGTEEMYRQAIEAGQVDPRQLRRKWVTAADERVRGSHARLNGQERLLGETWLADGGELRFPGDPNAPASETVQCRCVLSTRVTP